MQIKVDIAKLFREKKYSEIISIFDNKIPENQRNSRALIYLGVSRILKGEHSNKNFLLAINDLLLIFDSQLYSIYFLPDLFFSKLLLLLVLQHFFQDIIYILLT